MEKRSFFTLVGLMVLLSYSTIVYAEPFRPRGHIIIAPKFMIVNCDTTGQKVPITVQWKDGTPSNGWLVGAKVYINNSEDLILTETLYGANREGQTSFEIPENTEEGYIEVIFNVFDGKSLPVQTVILYRKGVPHR
ncbi:MAG: hypothetical protein U9P50_03560 [Patescibacteria group bacterium]|nr:hypothetical protein [Patescibacteria group bacterium]